MKIMKEALTKKERRSLWWPTADADERSFSLCSAGKPFYDWQVKNGRGFLLEVPENFPEKRELTVLESL